MLVHAEEGKQQVEEVTVVVYVGSRAGVESSELEQEGPSPGQYTPPFVLAFYEWRTNPSRVLKLRHTPLEGIPDRNLGAQRCKSATCRHPEAPRSMVWLCL